MERIDHPIPPLYDGSSRILILGSFPSVKSREAMFFYGHPQNRFWPVLAAVLKPVVVPVYAFLGADPAMFAGTILANDMGGGALAAEMTADHQAALLGGVLTGAMLGATIVFTLPLIPT